ncbi:DUF5610 domain-containing protein [Oceanicoccus sagamiensis]|uniref:DUF5610 domain-containing protein n=1 Tax=Oceanicoccus sagamiensis TaxID=716816 RepID=A0A1X9NLG1_9GAMM|nr:DUF5610 domain-containing protein [Oceanicoccus sagamiensis]ARN75667.1 hypothetical protein BST96_17070 [Oceanicoccus sagamiensis]
MSCQGLKFWPFLPIQGLIDYVFQWQRFKAGPAMNIPALLNSSLSGLLFPPMPAGKAAATDDKLPAGSLQNDVIALSATGQGLLNSEQQAKKVAPAYQLVAVNERPTPQQSADVILGFMTDRLQAMADEGAEPALLESAFQQAAKGFQQGLAEAKDILQGLQAMDQDIAAGIDTTEQLVSDGLEQLKQQLLGSDASPKETPAEVISTSRKVVAAYREQSTISSSRYSQSGIDGSSSLRGTAAAYADSYRRNDSVELSLKTQDGDLVTLSFSSALASDSSAAAVGRGGQAALAYERNSSFSSSFNLSVQGELDAGERKALNGLLEQVSALSDEFFNGDFDRAFAMAMDFEMDSSEFSAMSLDIGRSTSAAMVESYTASVGADAAVAGLTGLSDNVEQLLAMLENASNFADPKLLLMDLIANEMAQQLL